MFFLILHLLPKSVAKILLTFINSPIVLHKLFVSKFYFLRNFHNFSYLFFILRFLIRASFQLGDIFRETAQLAAE